MQCVWLLRCESKCTALSRNTPSWRILTAQTEEMVGSYAAQEQPYVKSFPEEDVPSGMMARGDCAPLIKPDCTHALETKCGRG